MPRYIPLLHNRFVLFRNIDWPLNGLCMQLNILSLFVCTYNLFQRIFSEVVNSYAVLWSCSLSINFCDLYVDDILISRFYAVLLLGLAINLFTYMQRVIKK